MTVIRLIRHGQATFGLKNYDQLSKLGVEQSAQLGRSLGRRVGEVDLVICGSMKRHRQTAEAAIGAMGVDLEPVVDDRWNELDHEQLIVRQKPIYRSKAVMVADLTRRGDPKNQFQKLFDKALERWTSGDFDAEYGEPWPSFLARTTGAFESLLSRDQKPANVLVFTSGGPISAVTAALLGLDAEGWMRFNRTCANCSETKFVVGRSGTSLVTWNAHNWFDADRSLLTYR